ncbi:MAG: hypothetical protein V4733_11210 [Verrucomicrobiota bacterium]
MFGQTATVDGLKFNLAGLPIPAKKKRHLRRGDYELPERILISKFVEPGMRVLELGASLGIISTFLARNIGPTGSLLSVEADLSLLPFWERNIHANGLKGKCVNALACPTWNANVPVRLLANNFQPCADKLSGRITASTEASARTVPWKTARTICEENDFEPTALIVDIEGTETVWTEEPANFPSSVRLLIAEFHPQYTGPDIAADCAQAVLDAGFRLRGYQNHVLAFSR